MNKLKFGIFDIDDNLLFMPTIVHLDRYVDGKWEPIDIQTSEFYQVMSTERTRLRNSKYHDTFEEQTDKGPRGDKSFLLDLIKAVKNENFGPSWFDFIETLVKGRLFLIITARSHEPESMKNGIKWIINNYLSNKQLSEMKDNIFNLYGYDIDEYLDECEHVGVMSDYFKSEFNVPDMKISQLVGHGKSLAIGRFLEKVNKYSKKFNMISKVGFSDDRRRTLDDVIEFLNGQKSDDIEYYVFDTSGGNKKKIKI